MASKKDVLITGAGGFLGFHVARHLKAAGWVVFGADRNPPPDARVFQAFRQGDLSGNGVLENLVRDAAPSHLLHFAGRADVGRSLRDPLDDFQQGPALVAMVLEAVRRWSPQTRVVLTSSAAVYGQPRRLPIVETADVRPLSPYGFHKWIGEILAAEYHEIYGVSTAALRVFSAYGAGLRKQLLWDLCQRCLQGEVVLGGSGEETRDFIHAEDVALAVQRVIEDAPCNGEIYNVASGTATTVRHMAELILCEYGLSLDRLRFSGQSRPGDPRFWQADVSPLRGLGFAPRVTLAAGVADYVKWFRNRLGHDGLAA